MYSGHKGLSPVKDYGLPEGRTLFCSLFFAQGVDDVCHTLGHQYIFVEQMVPGKLDCHMQKNEIGMKVRALSNIHTKINKLKMD